MKTLLSLIFASLLLAHTSQAGIVRIGLKMESGAPVYEINGVPCPREQVTTALTRISEIDKTSRIALDLTPSVTANIMMDIIKEMRALGLTGIVVVYQEILPLDIIPTYTLAVPIDLTNSSIHHHPSLSDENEAQQGGPGYPPQGVGSPDP